MKDPSFAQAKTITTAKDNIGDEKLGNPNIIPRSRSRKSDFINNNHMLWYGRVSCRVSGRWPRVHYGGERCYSSMNLIKQPASAGYSEILVVLLYPAVYLTHFLPCW